MPEPQSALELEREASRNSQHQITHEALLTKLLHQYGTAERKRTRREGWRGETVGEAKSLPCS